MNLERKVVDRNIALSLMIICIVLASALVGAVFSYAQTIATRDGTIYTLNSQLRNLTDISSLANTKVWIDDQVVNQRAGYLKYWTFSPQYAGYVVVKLSSTNITSTYIKATYSAYGVEYEKQFDYVPSNGQAVFPVLPCTNLKISIGSALSESGGHRLTITYYY
jgi:hypothetical protein